MTDKKQRGLLGPWEFALIVFVVGLVAVLAFLSAKGILAAMVALAVIGSIILVGIGVVITLGANWISTTNDQRTFVANAKENLSIMLAMQRVQNAQNTMLQRQAREARKQLPQGDIMDVDALLIEDAVFSELDE